MLGLLPLIHCTAAICTAAHDFATVIVAFVLQIPFKMLHHAAHSTATANCSISTQLLRSKQLKDHHTITENKSVGLHFITEAPSTTLLCLSEALRYLLHCIA